MTPLVLRAIKRSLDANSGYNSTMLWAVGFFGFLWCGEFTIPHTSVYDNRRHLRVADIAVDSHVKPTSIAVKIKSVQDGPISAGTTVYLGHTSNDLCPVGYMAVRPPGEGPLFISASCGAGQRCPPAGRYRHGKIQGAFFPYWGSHHGHSLRRQ